MSRSSVLSGSGQTFMSIRIVSEREALFEKQVSSYIDKPYLALSTYCISRYFRIAPRIPFPTTVHMPV